MCLSSGQKKVQSQFHVGGIPYKRNRCLLPSIPLHLAPGQRLQSQPPWTTQAPSQSLLPNMPPITAIDYSGGPRGFPISRPSFLPVRAPLPPRPPTRRPNKPRSQFREPTRPKMPSSSMRPNMTATGLTPQRRPSRPRKLAFSRSCVGCPPRPGP